MSFLEGLTLVGVGAAIFAVIVGVFSVWNGRMTRREVVKAITEAEKNVTRAITEAKESVTKAITETAEKISQLIVADGEKTRELLKPK